MPQPPLAHHAPAIPYDVVNEQSPIAQILTDTRGIVLWVNPAFTTMSGYTAHDIVGKNVNILRSDATPRTTYENLWQTISAGKIWTGYFENKRADGVLFHDYSIIAPIKDADGHTMAFASWKQKQLPTQDQSATLKETQEQLLASQRMAGIGIMAGTIAHDFNNILAAIMGYAEMIRMAPESPSVAQDAQRLLVAASQGRDINRQLLTYARKDAPKRIMGNFSRYVGEAISFLRATLPPSISIVEKLNAPDTTILIDPVLIHQMLSHIGTIAAHTMKEKGGTITLTLDHVLADGTPAPESFTGPSWLLLKIADTGAGLPPEMMPPQSGSNPAIKMAAANKDMGISIVNSIALLHGAELSIQSGPETGTQFTLKFPVVSEYKPPA